MQAVAMLAMGVQGYSLEYFIKSHGSQVLLQK